MKNATSANGTGVSKPSKQEFFEFRKCRLYAPIENLSVAIGLIQAQILAEGSGDIPDVIFGKGKLEKTATLEAALTFLTPLVDEIEDMGWEHHE